MYQIMIVDDEPILRNGIKNFIDWPQLNCSICALAENGEDALEQFLHCKPDILITDIKMPGMNGLDLTHAVYESFPETKVIILTGYSDFSYAQQAIRYGVVDFVIKNNPAPKIYEAVKKAIAMIERERKEEQMLDELEEIVHQSYDDLKSKFLADAIHGRLPADAMESKSEYLGLDLSGYYLAVIQVPASSSKADRSVVDYCISTFHSFQPFAFLVDAQIVCLVLASSDTDETAEYAQLNDLCALAVSTLRDLTGHSAHIGISGKKSGAASLHPAYQEATMAQAHAASSSNFVFRNDEAASQSANPIIAQTLQYIKEHYKEELTLHGIANHLHINASYLSRLFKRDMQENIVNYTTRYRIEHAKQLLLHTDAKLSQIASESGFNDASYFSSIFKKYTGYSPSSFKTKFSREH